MKIKSILEFILPIILILIIVYIGIIIYTPENPFNEQDCIDKFGNETYSIMQETSIGIVPLGAKYTLYCINNETKEWLVFETNLR